MCILMSQNRLLVAKNIYVQEHHSEGGAVHQETLGTLRRMYEETHKGKFLVGNVKFQNTYLLTSGGLWKHCSEMQLLMIIRGHHTHTHTLYVL